MRWRNKILLAKIEGTYGEDAAPTGAANAILATDVELKPMEGQDVSRELERPYLGAQPTVATDLHQVLSFKVEYAPSGTPGMAPAWGALLRACACAEVVVADTSVTYNPISDDPESATIHIWIDAIRFVLAGARGTAKLTATASGIPQIEFVFTALRIAPDAAARPAPDLSAWQRPQGFSNANSALSLAGASRVMRSFSLDLANQVEGRFLVGREDIRITDRADKIETTIEAVPLTDWDPYAAAETGAPVPLTLTHGQAAGSIATLAVPRAQVQRPSAFAQAQDVVEWPLALIPLPDAGNDQWTLTLT